MSNRMRVTFTVATVAVAAAIISIFLAARRRRKHDSSSSSCYLHSEQKPQSAFKRVLSDNSYTPFKHLSNDEDASHSHPFEAEITALLKTPPSEIEFGTEIVDLEMKDSYVWVHTETQLKELVDVLSEERFFAVDTEQHSLRSFQGFTALVQISTLEKDYLVDTIALHDFMGILRHVFANPSICKVFHGADNDIVWLQRDFHIYVVNLFDTSKACELLSKPQKSLAYLLETYCGVTTNKLLQREDWRQRPLSAEMVHYARTDAHFLLYIANCLINELKQLDNENSSSDKFHFVLEACRRSNTICLQLFTKEIEAYPGEYSALSLFSRQVSSHGSTSISNETQNIVRQLCAWRDLMARIHDESLKYVLSDQAIVALASQPSASHSEIHKIIAQADINMEMGVNSFIISPSPVVCSHLTDIYHMLANKLVNDDDDIYSVILQKCIGQNGNCPLSIFNYALLINNNLRPNLAHKQLGPKNSKQYSRKASRDLFVQKFSCKSPVYHNCRIFANDGRLLCYCDEKKLKWYLSRDLAKLVDEDPPAIMLLFEPKGRPEDEDNDFYIQSKKNICVGCGEGNHYLRYRIIPSCYRIHFPEHLKSHRSHDIVLLCVDCHEVAHAAAEKYKRKIAVEFGIPLYLRRVVHPGQKTEKQIEESGVSPLQLRTAAMALLRHGPRMPLNRREELTEIIKRYYGGRDISDEDLERALQVGMTPHERRRFEKKRGFSFKYSTGSTATVPEQNFDAELKADVDDLKADTHEGSYANEVDTELLIRKDDFRNSTSASDVTVNGPDSATLNENAITVATADCNEGGDSAAVDVDNSCLNRTQTNGLDDLSCSPNDEKSMHTEHNSKLSLLGHGPHGKQVVEHLLREYGEDGIREFCQRWRQVFVDAVKPRFLPGGWDVKHSGRRDFGEFSVYKPDKREASATAD
ncbi:protein RRP6-like 3 isoform X1 [Vigna unguiculata]|uniref:Exosome complex exonuclease RRP6 n=1 Tax=Vigna unguiculata TaxID=3917 RepID=A0A4D6LHB7_VIGUN|nr:protein RRP6-like 3 isoform X1 [Vigna unguiculata]QCD87933.1 exosome complex exonuclease RRP6 [Vigna unguiculata]